MKLVHYLPALLSLMMVPSFARSMPPPAPPVAGTEPVDTDSKKADQKDEAPPYRSNVGAVNEGGGSANTSGMNNGLTPNASGSGTNSARASDESGVRFGGTGAPKGKVEQEQPSPAQQ